MPFQPLRLGAAGGLVALLLSGAVALPDSHPATVHAFGYGDMSPIQKRILSGFASYELHPPAPAAQALVQRGNTYFPTVSRGSDCAARHDANIKVNQNCLNLSDPDLAGRGQAQNETAIAQDPLHPESIVAGYNDYRLGDGTCGISYSGDGGRSWSDSAIPRSFTRGTAFGAARQYWQAGGDPAVAWDTRGNAYYECLLFNRGAPTTTNPDQSSGVYVFRSTLNGGASWNFPGRPVIELPNNSSPNPNELEDKPYMAVDNHVGSPFRDRVYVTYTEFAADGTAYIYESYSSDYGEHFSARVLVSAASPLCSNTYGLPTPQGSCNENQDSQPFVGPDGALYVVFNNYNNSVGTTAPGADAATTNAATPNPNDNRNQILLAKSTDGGQTFGAPVKVADYYDLPDCATYQNGLDPGRSCVPEKGAGSNSYFRATNYPAGAVDPTNANRVVVTFGSYINAHSNETNGCTPTGFAADGVNTYDGVKTGGCNNDILLSASTDAGVTFTGGAQDPRTLLSVTQDAGQASSDQFWQWVAFTRDGGLAVSYYDRQYGSDETTGFSDISVSGASSAAATTFGVRRVTSDSMPPPTEFSGVFMGDYSGLTAFNFAHPLWTDTRAASLFLCPNTATAGTPPALCNESASNASLANDQDVYTASVRVPRR